MGAMKVVKVGIFWKDALVMMRGIDRVDQEAVIDLTLTHL